MPDRGLPPLPFLMKNNIAPLAIEEIFTTYKDRIYRLALSITRNENDAEDILQNTFLKVLKGLKNFRSASRISTWIYRIAYNESLQTLRKRRKGIPISDYLKREPRESSLGLFVNWSKLPDQKLLDDEFKSRVDNAIRDMPIKYRMALLLKTLEGLSIEEISKVLGIRPNSVKTLIHRARMAIKSHLIDYLKDRQVRKVSKDKVCSLVIKFIYDYVDGKLGEIGEDRFKRHIDDCEGCNIFLNRYSKAAHITRALECKDLPPELEARIETFIFDKKI